MRFQHWIIFCISIASQLAEEIVPCHRIDLNNSSWENLTFSQQEKFLEQILNEYNRNLTSLAYVTSAAEFESQLFLNESTKRRAVEKHYETYRNCLRTIASVTRNFNHLLTNTNNCSICWLLLRTQAIGDVADNNSALKMEIQTLKNRMREIYQRKFHWNKTKIGIDEVQEILSSLSSANDLGDLWNNTYNIVAPMRDQFATLTHLQNQQAKQNRLNDKSDTMTSAEERRLVEQLWKEIQPLYRLIHAFVRQQMSKIYPGEIQLDRAIPLHLTRDLFGTMMTAIEDEILPFPHVKGIDLGPTMRRKNLTEKDIFHYADEFFVSMNLSRVSETFWKKSVFQKISNQHMACHPTAFDMYKYDDVRIRMCTSLTSRDFYIVHHEMGHIQHYLQYKSLPFWFRRSPHGAFGEAIGDAVALASMSPTHLKRIGLLENFSSTREENIKFLVSQGLSRLFLPPYAYALESWRWSVYNGSIQPTEYNQRYWDLICEHQGMRPPVPRDERYFDAGTKHHVATDVSYIKYFLAHVFQFQIFDVLCREAGHRGPLHLCDLHGSVAAGKKLKILLGLGSSKRWEDILEDFAGVRTFSVQSCFKYFQPLREYLEELVEQGELNVGWTCSKSEAMDMEFSFVQLIFLWIFFLF